jgi:hypothetical protein
MPALGPDIIHTHTLSLCPVITPNAAKLANSSTGRIADLLETKEFLCPLICQVCAHEPKKAPSHASERSENRTYGSDPHRSSIATNIFISQEFSDGWKKTKVRWSLAPASERLLWCKLARGAIIFTCNCFSDLKLCIPTIEWQLFIIF